MAGQDQPSARRKNGRATDAEGQTGDAVDAASPQGGSDEPPSLSFPGQSPLYHAEHSDRYARQALIAEYEERFNCRLVVMVDAIFSDRVTFFEELIYDADPAEDLHLLLASPGGDGETAVRLVRSAQARCRELTVVVPDQAKSAATILVLGAHHILMGPTSDLGPVDPQFIVGPRSLVSAKDIIAAVEQAERAIAANPDSYPLHASLLADVNALMVQQARSALARTEDLVEEALRSNPDRSGADVQRLKNALKQPLIDLPLSHGAIFGSDDADKAGLPVIKADPASEQWKLIWRLWAKYFLLGEGIYEGRRSSRRIPNPPG